MEGLNESNEPNEPNEIDSKIELEIHCPDNEEFTDMSIYFEDCHMKVNVHSQIMTRYSKMIHNTLVLQKRVSDIHVSKDVFKGLTKHIVIWFFSIIYNINENVGLTVADLEILLRMRDYFEAEIIEKVLFADKNSGDKTSLSLNNYIRYIILCKKYKQYNFGLTLYNNMINNMSNWIDELNVFKDFFSPEKYIEYINTILKYYSCFFELHNMRIDGEKVKAFEVSFIPKEPKAIEIKEKYSILVKKANDVRPKYSDFNPDYLT